MTIQNLKDADVIQQAIDKAKNDPVRPLVVISCITYNHAPYLAQCLEGFVMQKTNFPFVALVHDDASLDGTAEILREYAEKYPDIIKPICDPTNRYSDKSLDLIMNEWINAYEPKYIAMCEGDDYWIDPLKLQKQVDFLDANPEYGMCYTRSRVYYQKKGVFGPIFGGEVPNTFESIAIENRIPTQTVIYRTQQYSQYLSDIDTSSKNWRMGDYPIYLWFAYNSRIHFISSCTAVYRCLPQSAAHFLTRNEWIRFRINAFEISRYFTERYDKSITSKVDEILHWYHFELAVFEIDRGKIRQYRKIIMQHSCKKITIRQRLLIYGSYCPMLYTSLFKICKFIKDY